MGHTVDRMDPFQEPWRKTTTGATGLCYLGACSIFLRNMVRIKLPKTKDRKDLKQRKFKDGDGLKAQIQAVGGDIAEDYKLLKDVDSDGGEDWQHASDDVCPSFYC